MEVFRRLRECCAGDVTEEQQCEMELFRGGPSHRVAGDVSGPITFQALQKLLQGRGERDGHEATDLVVRRGHGMGWWTDMAEYSDSCGRWVQRGRLALRFCAGWAICGR